MNLDVPVSAFLLSFLLIVPWVVFLRGRPLAFAAGATVVAIAAFAVEEAGQGLAGPVYGPAFTLVLLAPLTEELLKFGVSGATGRDYRAAAGVGSGFAATENALYFLAAWGGSTSTLVALVAVRALTGPLLHVTATSLTTLSWRGRPYGVPLGILLHIGWNASTLAFSLLPSVASLLLLGAAGMTVLGILVTLYRRPSFRAALRPVRTKGFPWAGTGG